METDGGGWTVFQRRMDGTQSFAGRLSSYINGFGDLNGEFWLNLNNIHRLTMLSGVNTTLRVDMDDFEGNIRFAKYSIFQILDATTDYQLIVGGYSGDAGDSLASGNGKPFVASRSTSRFSLVRAWWRDATLSDALLPLLVDGNITQHFANLNSLTYYRTGEYIGVETSEGFRPDGVFWSSWRGLFYSLRFTEMKLRRESSTLELQNSANRVFLSLMFLFISISTCSLFCM